MERASRALAAGMAAITIAGCAATPASPSPQELLRSIEAARTRADHEALAAYYAREGAFARASALEHRNMATQPLGAGRGSWTMPAHCHRLAESYAARAAELEGMALAQRQLAARAKLCSCGPHQR